MHARYYILKIFIHDCGGEQCLTSLNINMLRSGNFKVLNILFTNQCRGYGVILEETTLMRIEI